MKESESLSRVDLKLKNLKENTFYRKSENWASGNLSILHLRKVGVINLSRAAENSHYQNSNPGIIKEDSVQGQGLWSYWWNTNTAKMYS